MRYFVDINPSLQEFAGYLRTELKTIGFQTKVAQQLGLDDFIAGGFIRNV